MKNIITREDFDRLQVMKETKHVPHEWKESADKLIYYGLLTKSNQGQIRVHLTAHGMRELLKFIELKNKNKAN